MVSEKIIIALIVIAVLLSAVSVFVTLSAINTKMIPELNAQRNVLPDIDKGQVSLIIDKPEVPYTP